MTVAVAPDAARICVIRQYYFPLDTRVRREVDALVGAGHSVMVLCLRRTGEPRVERNGRLTILRMPLRHRRGGPARYCFEHLAFVLMAGAAAGTVHLRRPFDLVQVNTMPDTLAFAAVVPRLLGARLLLDLHECMPECFATTFGTPLDGPAARAMALLEQLSIRFCHGATTCTDLMRDTFIRRGTPPEKISVVLNGADESIFTPKARVRVSTDDPDRFVIVSHGTVEPRYGLDTVIRAVALLDEEMPGLRLEVYGEGSQLDDLRRLAKELGIEEKVYFSGRFVPVEELVQAIADADAGVVAILQDPYRDLTLCNKMYDFISMERPTIVSRTESVELYFGDSCFQMFRSGDEHDLARAIRELRADPALGARMVTHATRANASHRWPEQRRIYLDVVDHLLGTRAARQRTSPSGEERPAVWPLAAGSGSAGSPP